MRKIIRLLLALILGYVAFEVVDLWPVQPMWSKPFSKMAVVGFSEDEKYVFVLEGMFRRASYERGTAISFVTYEVATGTEKQRVEFSVPTDFKVIDVSPSADYSKLLLYGSKIYPTESQPGTSKDYPCYLFDTQTGQCIGGPWECGDNWNVFLSPDGRWIAHPGLHNSSDGLALISCEDGRTMFSETSKEQGNFLRGCRFSQDGSKLARIFHDLNEWYLEIISVPSGELISRLDLPKEQWKYMGDWKDSVISLMHISGTKQGTQSFRIEKDKLVPLDLEPLLQIENSDHDHFTSAGMKLGVISHARQRKAAWPDYYVRSVEWCDKHLGTTWSKDLNDRITFRFFDRPTGKLRLDIPVDNMISVNYTNLGCYFASYGAKTKLLEVWNINPFPRWPWAIGAALLTCLFVYFFPSLRRRSKTNGHVAQSPSLP